MRHMLCLKWLQRETPWARGGHVSGTQARKLRGGAHSVAVAIDELGALVASAGNKESAASRLLTK